MVAPERRLPARVLLAREERRTAAALRRSLQRGREQAFASETLRRLVRARPELAAPAGAGLDTPLLRLLQAWLPARLARALAAPCAAPDPAVDDPDPAHAAPEPEEEP